MKKEELKDPTIFMKVAKYITRIVRARFGYKIDYDDVLSASVEELYKTWLGATGDIIRIEYVIKHVSYYVALQIKRRWLPIEAISDDDDDDNDFSSQNLGYDDTNLQALENADECQRIFDVLSEDECQLLRYRFYGGLKWKEVAKLYNCTEKACTERYYKIVAKIKKRIDLIRA